MERLTAHGMFDARGDDRDAMPCDATINGVDCWPACAVAACELSGMLDGCRCDRDLDEALGHFVTLYEAGIVGDEAWRETALEVLADLESWGEETDRLAALN